VIDVRNTWWFVTIAVFLASGMVAVFIPGYRPGAFTVLFLSMLAIVFLARRNAKDEG
jgi:hypothetical protein